MNGAPASTSEVGGKPLPRAVRKAHARALELQKQQRERDGTPPETDPAPQATGTSTPASPAVAAPVAPVVAPAAVTPEPVPQAPTAEKPVVPPAPSEPVSISLFEGKDAKYWHDRYTSTLGVLRKERETHDGELERVASQLATAQAQVATATAPRANDRKLDDYLTAEQIANLGEDRAADVLQIAQSIARDEVSRIVKAELEPIRQRQEVQQRQVVRDSRQRVFAEIASAVPDWEVINDSPEWQSWCLQEDPNLGMQRQQVIVNAMSSNNSRPLINLFKQFLSENTAPPPPPPPPPPAPPVHPRANGASGNAPPAPQVEDDDEQGEEGPITSRAQVTKLFTKLALDRKLSDAQREKARERLSARVKRAQDSGQLR
jgi:hypothetical protein